MSFLIPERMFNSRIHHNNLNTLCYRYLFCCSGSAVKVYSTVSGECVRELRGHNDSVTGLAINPNNKLQVYFYVFVEVSSFQNCETVFFLYMYI